MHNIDRHTYHEAFENTSMSSQYNAARDGLVGEQYRNDSTITGSLLNIKAPVFIPGSEVHCLPCRSELSADAREFLPMGSTLSSSIGSEMSFHAVEIGPATSSQPNTKSSTLNPQASSYLPGACLSWDSSVVEVDQTPNQSSVPPEVHDPGHTFYYTADVEVQTVLTDSVVEYGPLVNSHRLPIVSLPNSLHPLPSTFPLPGPPAEDPPRQVYQSAENREYQRQAFRLSLNPDVHHFNYFGNAVDCKSTTPPALSLAIIMSKPKYFDNTLATDLHKSVLLTNAMQFVDPLIYNGPVEILLQKKGSALQDAVIGYCEKIYTTFGWWQEDFWFAEDDHPKIDILEDDACLQECATLLNGFSSVAGIPTRVDYLIAANEENFKADTKRKDLVQSRLRCGSRGSRLKAVSNVHELSEEVSGQHLRPVISNLSPAAVHWRSKYEDLFGPALHNWADDVDDESSECRESSTTTSESAATPVCTSLLTSPSETVVFEYVTEVDAAKPSPPSLYPSVFDSSDSLDEDHGLNNHHTACHTFIDEINIPASAECYFAQWEEIPDLWPDFDGVYPAAFSSPLPASEARCTSTRVSGDQAFSQTFNYQQSDVQIQTIVNDVVTADGAYSMINSNKKSKISKGKLQKGLAKIKKFFKKEINVLK